MNEERKIPDKGRMVPWVSNLKKQGGRRITINLRPEANAIMKQAMENDDFKNPTDMINKLISKWGNE